MNRVYLWIGIAVATLFTTGSVVVSNRTNKIDEFKSKLSDLSFCRTGFEIASSHPSYTSRYVTDPQTKRELISESNALDAKRIEIDLLIEDHLQSAADLPLDPEARLDLIEQVKWEAELKAVQDTGWIEEPDLFLDRINEICQPYIK